MKKVLLSLSALSLLFVGCGSITQPEPTSNVVPYTTFDIGIIVDSQKVLIDSSYQTPLSGEIISKENKKITLYKTTVFFKDKNYVIFITNNNMIGSKIEFILKDDKITNIGDISFSSKN